MKSTIVYIHGFDSSPQSTTAKGLQARFKGEKFMCPQINHRQDPNKLKKQFDNLARTLMDEDDVIIVGSSAGGLWADYMAIKYGFKTVLVNPALKPTTLFPSFGLPDAYIAKYAALEQLVAGKPRHNVVVFSGDKDDIVPTSVVNTHYKKPTILKGEGHRLANPKPVYDAVQRMIGNWPEHR